MSIVIKSWFLNDWGQAVPTHRKTWLEADKTHVDWQNTRSSESGFLNSSGDGSTFLTQKKTHEDWLTTEDGTPDFDTEGEEKYIED